MKIKYTKNYLLIFSICLIVISCSSTKQLKQANINLLKYHQGINNIEIISGITTSFKDNNLSANVNLKISQEDSLQMNIYAAFGINVAKLYSNPNKFIFYNMFENKGYIGKPSMENLYKIAKLNLNYSDFIKLIKSEIPGDLSKFTFFKKDEAKNEIIYKNKKGNETAEFVVLSISENKMLQYQQKNIDGTLVTNVFFKEYKPFNNQEFATKIVFQFPALEGEISFDFDEVKINPIIEAPFSFSIPSSAEKIILD
jgi:hypothetical protein